MDCQNITILFLYNFSFLKDKLMEPESGFRFGHFQEVCDISISLLLKSKYCAKNMLFIHTDRIASIIIFWVFIAQVKQKFQILGGNGIARDQACVYKPTGRFFS